MCLAIAICHIQYSDHCILEGRVKSTKLLLIMSSLITVQEQLCADCHPLAQT